MSTIHTTTVNGWADGFNFKIHAHFNANQKREFHENVPSSQDFTCYIQYHSKLDAPADNLSATSIEQVGGWTGRNSQHAWVFFTPNNTVAQATSHNRGPRFEVNVAYGN